MINRGLTLSKIQMKKILVIIDGLGDLPNEQLNNKTPLESADIPHLNELAKKSKLGYMYPIDENFAPESDTAILSILGNNIDFSSRGEFEALGAGIKVKHGDLVLRANFGTIDNLISKKVLDRRAGRTLTTAEAKELAKTINQYVKLPVKFEFFPTVQHRGVLVLYGGFSDNVTNTDNYIHEKGKIWVKEKFDWSKALDDDETSEFAANVINSFVDQSFKILDSHPVNINRRRKGLMAANIILTRDAGADKTKINQFLNSMAIVNMPLEKGIASASGMKVFTFDYPEMKEHDVYDNLTKGMTSMCNFAVKTLKKESKHYNFGFIHFKETDIPGHDNKPYEKKALLEILDKKFFSFLKEYLDKSNISLIVTADHSTPCKFKTHTSDPVPVLFYQPKEKGDNLSFGETNSRKGSLGRLYGKNLLKKAGFI